MHTAQPFSPVLRSVAHIKPIDKSQSSSFFDSRRFAVHKRRHTHRYDLSSDTPHPLYARPHERAPETSIDFAPHLVTSVAPQPDSLTRVFVVSCSASEDGTRRGRGGVCHLGPSSSPCIREHQASHPPPRASPWGSTHPSLSVSHTFASSPFSQARR